MEARSLLLWKPKKRTVNQGEGHFHEKAAFSREGQANNGGDDNVVLFQFPGWLKNS